MNEVLKVWGKFTKKIRGVRRGGQEGGSGGGSGW